MIAAFSFEHADPWAADFVDVRAVNAHASDAISERVEEISAQARRGPAELRSSSLLVLGPAGAGKTHLFARLRKKFGAGASFVLVRPDIGLAMTPRHMLAAIIDSLHRRCHGLEIRQIDAAVGALLAAVHQTEQRYPLMTLDDLCRDEAREAKLEAAISMLESQYDEVSASYLERLLAFPFATALDRRGLIAWLSGRELDDTQLKRLGLPGALSDQDVLPALRTLAIAAAFGAPIVLVFDQLENLVDGDEGNDRIHAHARLVSELFDSVRGLVIVQMALDMEWHRRISPALSQAERDRLQARVLMLPLPTPAEREALLDAWLDAIPREKRKGYFPWPFDEQRWSHWRTALCVTPRMLMVACREAYEGTVRLPPAEETEVAEGTQLDDRLEAQWETYVQRARGDVADAAEHKRGVDRERIVAALLRSARLGGIKATPRPARAPGDVMLDHQGRSMLVFVVQQPSARSVVSSLNSAAAAAATQDVVLLRERRIPIPSTWKSATQPLEELKRQRRARWVELDDDRTAHLLAVHDFLSSARSGDISDARGRPVDEAAVREWLARKAQDARWTLVPELLHPAHDTSAPPPAPQPAILPDRRFVAAPQQAAFAPDALATRSLRELRVASVERIVREVRASRAGASKASVVAELRAAGSSIGWVGASIVFFAEAKP